MEQPTEAQLVHYVERITKRVCPGTKVGSGEHPEDLNLPHVYLGYQEVGMYQARIWGSQENTWIVYKGVETPSSTIRGVPSDPGDWEYEQLMETVNVGEAVKRMILAYVESVIDDCYEAFSEEEEEQHA